VEWLFFVEETIFYLRPPNRPLSPHPKEVVNTPKRFETLEEIAEDIETAYKVEQPEDIQQEINLTIDSIIDNSQEPTPIGDDFTAKFPKSMIRPLQIHTDSSGLWDDLLFAHSLVEFIDVLCQRAPIPSTENTSLSNDPAALYNNNLLSQQKISRIVERLDMFNIRLMLYMINEATSFDNYYNVETRKDKFKNLLNMVTSQFNQNTLIIKSMTQYLEGKTKQWNAESSDVDNVFRKALTNLNNCVIQFSSKSLRIDMSNYMLYIAVCIYHAILQASENQEFLSISLKNSLEKVGTCLAQLINIPSNDPNV